MTEDSTNAGSRGTRPGSVADRLANLAQGENVTLSIAHGPAADSFDAWVIATKKRMHANTAPTIARVRDRHPERVFEAETGVMISSQNRAHVVMVITRLADLA
jgi:hypothetical protein